MPPDSQRGAALLVTLVLVALISLLAFGASQATRVQQQLATNEATREIAFQAAEAALREAERTISDASDLSLFCEEEGASRYAITEPDQFTEDERWKRLETDGAEADFSLYDSQSEDFVSPPRYLIGCISPELIDSYWNEASARIGKNTVAPEVRHFFRIFTIGFGPDGTAQERLEARYVF